MNVVDPLDRELIAFFDKMRTQMRKIKAPLSNQNEHINRLLRDSEVKQDDGLYGVIKQSDMQLLLSEYDKQLRLNNGVIEKPLTCDAITGKSYAKLLHSRRGFHNPASTAILVEKLGINDVRMDSFLGGHSTYLVREGEDVSSLRKRNRATNIRVIAKRFHQALADEEDKDKRAAILELDNMLKLDPKDSNSIACRGLLAYSEGLHTEAAADLREALKGSIERVEEVRAKLVISLYEIGMKFFNTCKYNEAISHFDEALKHDPKHAGSDLHKRISHDKLNSRVGVRGFYGAARK